jgi:hypothetical protein
MSEDKGARSGDRRSGDRRQDTGASLPPEEERRKSDRRAPEGKPKTGA